VKLHLSCTSSVLSLRCNLWLDRSRDCWKSCRRLRLHPSDNYDTPRSCRQLRKILPMAICCPLDEKKNRRLLRVAATESHVEDRSCDNYNIAVCRILRHLCRTLSSTNCYLSTYFTRKKPKDSNTSWCVVFCRKLSYCIFTLASCLPSTRWGQTLKITACRGYWKSCLRLRLKLESQQHVVARA
jgi:hypothetical protein